MVLRLLLWLLLLLLDVLERDVSRVGALDPLTMACSGDLECLDALDPLALAGSGDLEGLDALRVEWDRTRAMGERPFNVLPGAGS